MCVQVARERGRQLGGEERLGEFLRAFRRLRPEGEQRGEAGRVGAVIGEPREDQSHRLTYSN